MLRAFIPKTVDQEFRYLNLGAGAGQLDEVLLAHFPGANATLVDNSLTMLTVARQNLSRFGNRVEYIHANLLSPDWVGAVTGPFDFTFSTIAVHNLREPKRIRELYQETYRLMGHGGMFMNLDYVRPSRPSLAPLHAWAARDEEAGFAGKGAVGQMPGTLLEHLSWLGEAGFTGVEVFWKDMNMALVCGIRDHIHFPGAAAGGHGAEGAHSPTSRHG
jgi:SAM-dependent methyltransferase